LREVAAKNVTSGYYSSFLAQESSADFILLDSGKNLLPPVAWLDLGETTATKAV
jgi:hypothetical protein